MMGQSLGHYRIAEQIGAGGMGVVYRARDERLDRDVAIKVLPGDALADEAARRRFRNEALALSRTSHPNIATVHDFDSQAGVHFLVMEYIPGVTVSERVAGGPLPEGEVLRLGIGLADGLAAAHAQGIVHRDVKPGNLRLTSDGRLKILDFGIARLRHASAETTHTDTGARPIGTLAYMAPEQARGIEADARSDIFSAGAVLYEMATGRRAHPGRQDAEVLDAILYRTPPPPRALGRAISPALEACILKALDKAPDRRYQSARELLVDLQRIADAPSHAVAAGRRAWVWPHRTTRAWLGLGAAALLIALVALASLFVPHEAPPRATPSEGGRLKLAVLPAQDLTTNQGTGEWPSLIQALFASELTGLQDVGVMDPLSLNSLIERATATGGRPRAERLTTLLREAGVDLVIDSHLARAAGGYELRANLLDPANGEIRFSGHAAVADEQALGQSVAAVAEAIVGFLQVQVLAVARDQDLRPWLSYRTHNIQAVKAFAQANQYIFRYQRGESERFLRRAIELDPAFIAPRVWLVSGLFGQGRKAEAEAQHRDLSKLESKASPFEQTMMAFVGALVRGDVDAQARHLEIALEYSPGNNILLVNLGGIRAQRGDCRGALEAFDVPIASLWRFPPLYPLWGWCAIAEGRVDAAREVLEASLEIEPVHPNVYALLEALMLASNRPADASRYAQLHAEQAGKLGLKAGTSELVAVYDRLGRHSLASGAYAPAAALFQKAVSGAPKTAAYYDALAEALTRLGQPAEAQQAAARAKALRQNMRR